MFTWVCPSCGKEWDIATAECPDCRGKTFEAAPAGQGRSGRLFWVLLAAGTGLGVAGLFYWARYQNHRLASAPEVATAASQSAATKDQPPLEPAPEPSSAPQQIEVAGIRPFYDSRNKPQVRALIVNHGETALENLTLTVTLRPLKSAPDSLPLAKFTAQIVSVKPGEWREVKAPLDTYATLAAMPNWRELRADVEAH
ncbi:MAG: hypothetical protein HY236_09595 [Acidobacteria bacterium]|nr:hypothetical protein [Acidobacteriota bacterium]